MKSWLSKGKKRSSSGENDSDSKQNPPVKGEGGSEPPSEDGSSPKKPKTESA